MLRGIWPRRNRRAIQNRRCGGPAPSRTVFETLIAESASDACDRVAPYLALLRAGHDVAITLGPDRAGAWLVRTPRRVA